MDGNMTVSLDLPGKRLRMISLWFNPQWSERVAIFRRNQSISVVGQIKTIGGLDITLINCELTE
jgi:hypothetical protein